MKVFVQDMAKCIGCHTCQFACKDEHSGNDWTPYAKPQPETGQFWRQVKEVVLGSAPKARLSYVPSHMCNHCDSAACVKACPMKAITKRQDGLVLIEPAKCNGCELCVDACPYGNIWFNKQLKLAQKCTGCAHLVDRGWPIKEPRCVDACIPGALKFGEEADLKDLIAKAEVMHPEYGTKPRVYYLNLPKKFIAGTVYDPGNEEVVIGATLTLSGDASATLKTDAFGDFWFEGLKEGNFSLKIEAGGKSKTIANISTKKDVNLGDIALS
ncbi:MAG: carboxypeptidase regulatory-like domain-containing protein [Chloroflexi bacterium]|nr:carboxypeptidase regulatory-like domain-containing protein [Chloroflexota bacterium]